MTNFTNLTSQDILQLNYYLSDFKELNPKNHFKIANQVKRTAIKQVTSDFDEYQDFLTDCDDSGFYGKNNAFSIHEINLMCVSTNSIPFKNLLAWYQNDLKTLLTYVNGAYLKDDNLYFYMINEFDYQSNLIITLSNGMYFTNDSQTIIEQKA